MSYVTFTHIFFDNLDHEIHDLILLSIIFI